MRFPALPARPPVWCVVLLGVGAAALFTLSDLLVLGATLAHGGIYGHFTFLNPDAMFNLAPMIRDVVEGHLRVSDGRVFEHAGLPSLWSFWPAALSALFAIVAGGSVAYGMVLGRFVMVLVAFPLAYLVARRIVGRPWFALAAAFLFFGPTLLFLRFFPTSFADVSVALRAVLPLGGAPREVSLSLYNSYAILPGLPFLLGAILLLLRAAERPTVRRAAAAGVALGVLPYLYVTYAVWIGSVVAFLGLMALVRRSRKDLVALGTLLAVAAVTASGYVVGYHAIRSLPYAQEFYDRLGGDITHAFRWSRWPDYLWYLAAAAAALGWGIRRGRTREGAVVAAFALSGIALWNVQAITGYNPAPQAWLVHQIPISLAIVALVLADLALTEARRRSARLGKAVAAAFVVFVVLAIGRTVQTQVGLAAERTPYASVPPALASSFRWIDASTPPDAVVATPSLVSNALLPFLSHARVTTPRAITSSASEAEILDRWMWTYALFGVSTDRFAAALRGDKMPLDPYAANAEQDLAVDLYEYSFVPHTLDATLRHPSKGIPADALDALVAAYAAYPKDLPTLLAKPYRVNYLYVGPYERAFGTRDFDASPLLVKAHDADGVTIYAVTRQGSL